MKTTHPLSILILNGPNLNLLGEREPEIYGSQTLQELNLELEALGEKKGIRILCYQSNHEGALIDKLQDLRHQIHGIVINAAGYTHTSVALRDAVLAVNKPMVEVHLSDITKRESFRKHSYFSDIALSTFMGEKSKSYTKALEFLIDHIKNVL